MSEPSGRDELFASLQSIADGASLYLLANVVVNGSKFALSLLLARGLGAELYGLFAFGRKLAATVLAFATLGADVATVRFVSANREDPILQGRIFGLAVVTTVVASTVAAAGVFALAPTLSALTLDHPAFTTALRVFALAIPFEASIRVVSSGFKGLERPAEKSLVRAVLPVVRLAGVVAALLLGTSLLGVVAGFAVGSLLVLVVAVRLLLTRTDLSPRRGLASTDVRGFFDYALPLTVSRAGSILHKRIDIFMIGFFLAAADLAVYNVAMVLAGVVALPLAGFNQFFPPVAARLADDGDRATLASVYRLVTRWSITVALAVAAPLLVYRTQILAVYGAEFTAGGLVVVLFLAGQLVNAASGPSNDLLQMTDHQYLVMVNHWGLAVCNAVLNFFLIQSHGIVGAAMATAGVLALTNLARVLEVWYVEGLVAYSRRLWKPVAAGLGAVAVMVLARSALEGLVLVAAGSVLGELTFLAILLAAGLESRDKEFVAKYVTDLTGDGEGRGEASAD